MSKKYTLFSITVLLSLSCQSSKIPSQKSDIERVKTDLVKITKTESYRFCLDLDALNNTAAYIYSEFEKVCDTVYYQEFKLENRTYKNVVASINTNKKERLVIGAHYDVCGQQEGADDNASGVVGVLELARLLSKEELDYRVDFVAYTLEEPPYFGTHNMGSYVHAKSLSDKKVKVKGMICLEMIGFFNDEPNSQKYPIGILSWLYGNKGNFITVVQKLNNGRFGKEVVELMTGQNLLPTKSFIGPKKLPGIDFSDHSNYWEFGYNAVMITNTAFYRNPNYHQASDKLETLDLKRICKVIDEVCFCILNL